MFRRTRVTHQKGLLQQKRALRVENKTHRKKSATSMPKASLSDKLKYCSATVSELMPTEQHETVAVGKLTYHCSENRVFVSFAPISRILTRKASYSLERAFTNLGRKLFEQARAVYLGECLKWNSLFVACVPLYVHAFPAPLTSITGSKHQAAWV